VGKAVTVPLKRSDKVTILKIAFFPGKFFFATGYAQSEQEITWIVVPKTDVYTLLKT
jgi:hypothetical protein